MLQRVHGESRTGMGGSDANHTFCYKNGISNVLLGGESLRLEGAGSKGCLSSTGRN